jgi:ABC-type glycerol-3-phosphate transport system substrate-binding protein
MKKIIIVLLAVAFLASMLMAGAGCKAETAATTAAATTAAATTAAAETTAAAAGTTAAAAETTAADITKFKGQTIIVKCSPDMAMSGLKGKTEEFAKLYGVTVDYNEIGWDVWFQQSAQILATDEPLDVMGNGKNAWIEFPEKLTPLNDMFPEMFSKMVPELVQYSTLGENIMAVPFLPSYQIMFYNKSIFEKAGATIPETWAEFKTTIKLLNDYNGKFNYVADWTTENFFLNFILMMQSSGVKEYQWTGDALKFNFDAPETIETVKFMKSLLDEGLIDPGVLVQIQQEVASLFDQGDIAMMSMWEMYAGFLSDEAYANTGYFAFPGREKGMTGTLDGHEYLMIPKSAPNPELAAEYIKFIASYENTKTRSIVDKSIAVYTDQFTDPEVMEALPFLSVIDMVKGNLADQFPPIKGSYELRIETATQIHPALLGETPVEDACAALQAYADVQTPVKQ